MGSDYDSIMDLVNIILLLVAAILSLYLHEGGHYYAAKLLGAKSVKVNKWYFLEPKIVNINKWGKKAVIKIPRGVPKEVKIDDEHFENSKNKVIFSLCIGVLMGLIPLFLVFFILNPYFKPLGLIVVVIYLRFGSNEDLNRLSQLIYE